MNKLLTTGLTLMIVVCMSSAFVQAYSLPKSIERGKEVYTTFCQNCHMENGQGVEGMNPPVAKSDYLKHPVNDLIKLVLKGQTGNVKVNGTNYSTPMLPLDYLNDEQIADALNYVRNSWGNKNQIPVTPEQIKKLRN
jgi:mono/diheme cytochrome c family protein